MALPRQVLAEKFRYSGSFLEIQTSCPFQARGWPGRLPGIGICLEDSA